MLVGGAVGLLRVIDRGSGGFWHGVSLVSLGGYHTVNGRRSHWLCPVCTRRTSRESGTHGPFWQWMAGFGEPLDWQITESEPSRRADFWGSVEPRWLDRNPAIYATLCGRTPHSSSDIPARASGCRIAHASTAKTGEYATFLLRRAGIGSAEPRFGAISGVTDVTGCIGLRPAGN